MKKYYICFFLLAVFLTASVLTGAYVFLFQPERAQPVPGQILESEIALEDNAVINQDQVTQQEGRGEYCLVAENDFLLVFSREKEDVCLDTHMPLSDFPPEEQEKLLEGLWFSTMMDVFSYLESYTS